MEMHWIYHPKHAAKVVNSHEFDRLLNSGWYENPSHFPSNEEREMTGLAFSNAVPEKETDNDENVKPIGLIETDPPEINKKKGKKTRDF